jgi:hypothetical protein
MQSRKVLKMGSRRWSHEPESCLGAGRVMESGTLEEVGGEWKN